MNWEINRDLNINNRCIITSIRVQAVSESSEVPDLQIKAPFITNGILTFVIDSISRKLTQSSRSNEWQFKVYCKFNFRDEEHLLATSNIFESKINSRDISYKGINVIYIDLSSFNWDGFICIPNYVGKDSSRHVIDFSSIHKDGVRKSDLNLYVGNEFNANLHNQNI